MAQTGLIQNAMLTDKKAKSVNMLNALDGTDTIQKTTLAPENTVEGRIGNIIKSGSPLMEDAQTRAAQAANKRGLINSSMAVGEGERALYAAALPIAQQDAQASNAYGLQKQQGEIETGLQRLRGGQSLELQQMQGDQAMSQQELQGQQATTLQELQGQQQYKLQTTLQQMQGEQAQQLTQIEGRNKMLLQSSQSAAMFFSQNADSIGQILSNPDIPTYSKEVLVQQQLMLLENGLSVIGSIGNMDLGSLLDFGDYEMTFNADTESSPPVNYVPTTNDNGELVFVPSTAADGS